MLRFNLNQTIKVKPTPHGRAILLGDGYDYSPDENGYIAMQAWHVMQLFGPNMRLGSDSDIELDILIDEKYLIPELAPLGR